MQWDILCSLQAPGIVKPLLGLRENNIVSDTQTSWCRLQSRYFTFNNTFYILSPPVMNVSMIIWAPLKKSPNCASQMGRMRGFSILTPYSKPRTASSDSGLLATYHYKVVKLENFTEVLRMWEWVTGVLDLLTICWKLSQKVSEIDRGCVQRVTF